ncbi:hypothetical protein MY4038_003052 [Beauveria bassiana]
MIEPDFAAENNHLASFTALGLSGATIEDVAGPKFHSMDASMAQVLAQSKGLAIERRWGLKSHSATTSGIDALSGMQETSGSWTRESAEGPSRDNPENTNGSLSDDSALVEDDAQNHALEGGRHPASRTAPAADRGTEREPLGTSRCPSSAYSPPPTA